MPKKNTKENSEEQKPIAQKIVVNSIVKEMSDSYIDYAMSVIVSRALPDVRDGLKPVHRRILFTMHEAGLSPSSKHKKSAKVVGDALGKYHPHGDTALYDAMARLAQDFRMRYPMVNGQGNWGSIDGDSPAAMRYTEAKMTPISQEMLRDIEKNTVNFIPNYDNSLKEPSILPATIPYLLLNGTLGIAVGMATDIPPHNLGEVMDGLVHLVDNPDCNTEDLMKFIKGPDYPTGGIIYNHKDIHQAYATGKGSIVTRGEAEVVETKKGGFDIIITSITYQTNKSDLIMKIADLVRDKKIEGIKDIRDDSDRTGLRIVIELKTGGNPQRILNALYKHTDLEKKHHLNMLALVDEGRQPQILRLKDILEHFVEHRKVVVKRRAEFDLDKAEARAHILEGLKKALDNIDDVIKIIKTSKDREVAKIGLMKKFKFTEIQAVAILEMRLQTLVGLESKKIEDELKEKLKLIKELKDLLKSPAKMLALIKDEFIAIREKFGDERKTKFMARAAKIVSVEDTIPEQEVVMVLTKGGYVKRTDPDSYKAQNRGGTGVIDINTKDEDFVNILITANTHDDLLFFTDKGKVYQTKMYDLPEGKRATKGKPIINFLQMGMEEKVTSVLAYPEVLKEANASLIMVTKDGVVKKVDSSSFKDVRRSGIVAIKLQKDDELSFAHLVSKGDDVILATQDGQSIRFHEADARTMGRAAGGVRAIKLGKGDKLVGAGTIKKGEENNVHLLTMSKNGYGKKTLASNYRIQKRGGSGIKTSKVTDKTGPLMIAKLVTPETGEVIAISQKGQIIRTSIEGVPALGRQTQGVKIMRLKAGDSIASLTCL